MAAKKSRAKGFSRARTRTAAAGDRLGQLRAAIAEIRTRVESEAKKRGIEFPRLDQTARAPQRLVAEINALRQKGLKLGSRLTQALGNPGPRRFKDQARSMLGAMKAEIEQRTSEIKNKSEQLNRLMRRSARQALEILQSKPKSSKRRSSSRVGS